MGEKEFAKELGIKFDGYETTDGAYVIDLPNSNEFSKIYTLLDKNEDIDLDIEGSHFIGELIEMLYLAEDFDILLKGDLKNNAYSVEIKEAI